MTFSYTVVIGHVRLIFQVLANNKLYAKLSKCRFGVRKVDYLGHIVSAEGVAAEEEKVKAIWDWLVPKTLKALRGFLGLAGYYKKYVRGYSTLSSPLTSLTKKNAFHWSTEAQQAFNALKTALASPPVLALPDFNQPFVIECDASASKIGAILIQSSNCIYQPGA